MDILKQFNNAIAYIEESLSDEIDTNKITEIALCPYDKFKRFFSYMTNMSVSEYIRKRRLTLAAYELLRGQEKIIDLAVKYGYSSADSFTRAFAKQHGVLPTEVNEETQLKVYSPVSFYVAIKGISELKFRIENIDSIKLRGISKEFIGTAADRFEQEHIMWSNQHDDVQNQVCKTVEGVWYGIWNNGIYSIAKKANEINNPSLSNITIPSGKYAVFSTDFGGFAGDVLPNFREEIFDCWLPDSGYKQTDGYEVEVYYLYHRKTKSINGTMKYGYPLLLKYTHKWICMCGGIAILIGIALFSIISHFSYSFCLDAIKFCSFDYLAFCLVDLSYYDVVYP